MASNSSSPKNQNAWVVMEHSFKLAMLFKFGFIKTCDGTNKMFRSEDGHWKYQNVWHVLVIMEEGQKLTHHPWKMFILDDNSMKSSIYTKGQKFSQTSTHCTRGLTFRSYNWYRQVTLGGNQCNTRQFEK